MVIDRFQAAVRSPIGDVCALLRANDRKAAQRLADEKGIKCRDAAVAPSEHAIILQPVAGMYISRARMGSRRS
jgi:hypothetical protein